MSTKRDGERWRVSRSSKTTQQTSGGRLSFRTSALLKGSRLLQLPKHLNRVLIRRIEPQRHSIVLNREVLSPGLHVGLAQTVVNICRLRVFLHISLEYGDGDLGLAGGEQRVAQLVECTLHNRVARGLGSFELRVPLERGLRTFELGDQ